MYSFAFLLPTFLSCVTSSLAAPAAVTGSHLHHYDDCDKTSHDHPGHHNSSTRNIAYMGYYYENEWQDDWKFNSSSKPISLLPLAQNGTGVTHVNLFQVTLSEKHSETPFIHGYEPNSTYFKHLWPEVKTVQKQGVKVLLSLGGYRDDSFMRLNYDFEKYYPALLRLLKTYNIDGLDLDIEPSSTYWVPEDIDLPLHLLQRLHSDMGKDFILTMAPVASDLVGTTQFSGFSYKALDKAAVANTTSHPSSNEYYSSSHHNATPTPKTKKSSAHSTKTSVKTPHPYPQSDSHPHPCPTGYTKASSTPAQTGHPTGSSTRNDQLIHWFNAQFYDKWGWAGSTHDYEDIVAAGWDPSRVVMGVEDNGFEGACWVKEKQLVDVVRQLRQKYSHFGGIDGWEYARAGGTDGLREKSEWFKVMSGALYAPIPKNATYSPAPIPKDCKPDPADLPLPSKTASVNPGGPVTPMISATPTGTRGGRKETPNASMLAEEGVSTTDLAKLLAAATETPSA